MVEAGATTGCGTPRCFNYGEPGQTGYLNYLDQQQHPMVAAFLLAMIGNCAGSQKIMSHRAGLASMQLHFWQCHICHHHSQELGHAKALGFPTSLPLVARQSIGMTLKWKLPCSICAYGCLYIIACGLGMHLASTAYLLTRGRLGFLFKHSLIVKAAVISSIFVLQQQPNGSQPATLLKNLCTCQVLGHHKVSGHQLPFPLSHGFSFVHEARSTGLCHAVAACMDPF